MTNRSMGPLGLGSLVKCDHSVSIPEHAKYNHPTAVFIKMQFSNSWWCDFLFNIFQVLMMRFFKMWKRCILLMFFVNYWVHIGSILKPQTSLKSSYRIPNIEKYLTADTGNPAQTWQSWMQNSKYWEILNSGNGKSNPKIAIVNAQFEILRNT